MTISAKIPHRRFLTLTALLLMLGAFMPASASAFTKAIWYDPVHSVANQFPLYHRMGVGIVEMDLDWAQTAPTRPKQAVNPRDPAYHWPADIDQALAQARHYHMRVLVQVMDTPKWADGHQTGTGYWAPSNPFDYSRFMAAAARRYPGVHMWMVWGEPTKPYQFQLPPRVKESAPQLYARMVDATYGTLKHLNRSNIIIGGNTYTYGLWSIQQWIADLKLPNGKPPRMDMYGHNPFSYQSPQFTRTPSPDGEMQFSDLHRLAGLVDHYLRRGMPLFLSEFTIPTYPDKEFNFWVDPKTAAQWVAEALKESRAWHRIYAFGWIHVYDNPPYSYGGLLTQNGHPKPDYWPFVRG